MAAKDVNYANTFKNVRTALLYTQAPTLAHIDMVRPNPSECCKVNTMLFSKWLADPVRFGCFHTLGGDRKALGCSSQWWIFFLPLMTVEEMKVPQLFKILWKNKPYLGDGSRRDGSENSWRTAVLLEYITVSAIISLRLFSLDSSTKTVDVLANFGVRADSWNRARTFRVFGFPKNWGQM